MTSRGWASRSCSTKNPRQRRTNTVSVAPGKGQHLAGRKRVAGQLNRLITRSHVFYHSGNCLRPGEPLLFKAHTFAPGSQAKIVEHRTLCRPQMLHTGITVLLVLLYPERSVCQKRL